MKRDRFANYPCLKDSPPVSERRRRRLATLSEMAAQERWLSDFYLFGFSPFHVDLRNLVKDLSEMAEQKGMSLDKIDPDMPLVIPYALVAELFQRKLEQSGISVRILEKVASLDSPGKRVSFFDLKIVTDEMQKSLGRDDVLIYHRFEGNTVQSYRVGSRNPPHSETAQVSIEGKEHGRERKEKRT
jgi:hypothetical protein